MDSINKDQLFVRVNDLREIQCHDSAEKLLSFFLSTLGNADVHLRIECCELLGDIAFDVSQFRKAQSVYNQTFNLMIKNRLGLKDGQEWEVKFKECLCLIQLQDHATAAKELETIPIKFRGDKVNLCLGRLYVAVNLRKNALPALKSVLLSCPFALEAIESLIDIGIDGDELLEIVRKSSRDNSILKGWLESYTAALLYKRECSYTKCDNQVKKLAAIFPQNVHVLSCIGRVAFEAEKFEEAGAAFRAIRRIDPTHIDHMDCYGNVLALKGEDLELSRLASDVLAQNPQRAEGWLIAACFCDLKGETDKALTLVEKAIRSDRACARSFRVKGQILLKSGHADKALICFYQAGSMARDAESFVGIISANLVLGNLRQAMRASQEAAAALPMSSIVHIARGSVLLKAQNQMEEAIKSFALALRLNPRSQQATAALASALMEAGRLSEALTCLQRAMEGHSSSQLHMLYAKALGGLRRYTEAVGALQVALSLAAKEGSDTAEATQELEKIEGMIRDGDGDGIGGGEEMGGDGIEEDEYEEHNFLRHGRERSPAGGSDLDCSFTSAHMGRDDGDGDESEYSDGRDDAMLQSHLQMSTSMPGTSEDSFVLNAPSTPNGFDSSY